MREEEVMEEMGSGNGDGGGEKWVCVGRAGKKV